jgi:hypothetical protein
MNKAGRAQKPLNGPASSDVTNNTVLFAGARTTLLTSALARNPLRARDMRRSYSPKSSAIIDTASDTQACGRGSHSDGAYPKAAVECLSG